MSYLKTTDSRGTGAVARSDLGTVSLTAVQPTTSQLLSTGLQPSRPPTTQVSTTVGHVGTLLLQPFRRHQVSIAVPSTTTSPVVQAYKSPTETAPAELIARPGASTTAAGLMPGEPPPELEEIPAPAPAQFAATHTPTGPSLSAAVRRKKAREDAAAEAAKIEAALTVPEISAEPRAKTLLIIGGVAAVGLYLLMRKA